MKETKDEKNLSAVKTTAQKNSRVPLKNADPRWQGGDKQTPRERKAQTDSVNIRTTGADLGNTTVVKPSFSFPRTFRLRLKSEFQQVFTQGKKFRGNFMMLVVFVPEKKSFKTAAVVRKKFYKRAVDRNKIKRRLREIIRLNKFRLPENLWLVVLAEQKILNAKFNSLEKEFIELCEKAGLL